MRDFKDLNAFQTLAVFGIIFSVIVQTILTIIQKHVDTIWALYPTWVAVFIFGTIIKRYIKYDDHPHTH